MTSMLEALRKAGLVSDSKAREVAKQKLKHTEKTDKKERHKLWQERAFKNRFGDIALFEIWDKSKAPPDCMKKCCLCGAPLTDSAPWVTPNKKHFKICLECRGNT